MVQPDPKVIRVEEAVSFDVLKGGVIRLGTLGGFPEQKATGGLGPGKVSSLSVCSCAVGHFHEEWNVLIREVAEQLCVDRRSKIIGIGDERVTNAFREQLI